MNKGTLVTLALVVLGCGALTYHYNSALFEGMVKSHPQEKAARKAVGKPAVSQAGKKKKGKKKKVEASALPRYTSAEISQMLEESGWMDSLALEKKLTEGILGALPDTDKASVAAFLADPAKRLMLAQWAFVHAENAQDDATREKRLEGLRAGIRQRNENLSRLSGLMKSATGADREYISGRVEEEMTALKALEVELHSPRSMKDTLAAEPESVALLRDIMGDAEWLEQILYTGECENPGRMLAVLTTVARQTSDMNSPMPRAIATATALEWAKHDWDMNIAAPRALFFIDNDKDNRFHAGFRTLPFWQLRLLCGCKGNDENGSVESLEWALDNVHLPSDRYSGSCWQAQYLLENLFGDSVHGAEYYGAYDGVYKKEITGRNALRRTFEVGGVCGSLSHFGACSALANGVPALPMGEPEHCAYVVLVNGKWTPAYSLSWQRGLHWEVWKHVNTFSSLHVASELYDAHGKSETSALSNAYTSLARLFAAQGDKEKALACHRSAVELQPCNYPAWRDYASFVQKFMPDSAEAWGQLNEAVCTGLAPRYPEIAAGLLRMHVYPQLQNLPTRERAAVCAAFWKAVEGLGPDRWDIEGLCTAQFNLLRGKAENAAAPDADMANKVYSMILQRTIGKPAYAPVILSWGNNLAASMGEETQKSFLQATLKALSTTGAGTMDSSDRDRMLGQALLGAANMHDRSSFQAIGKLLSEKYHKPQQKLPNWEPLPGKLVSQGGLLRISSTSQYDDPAAHWGILEPTVGGRFHTDKNTDAYAVVELPKMAYISGVVTIAPDGNLERLGNMKVQYSESGRDDDWHDAGAMLSPTSQRVNRLELQGTQPRARFIRILRPGGPEYFHLNGIFVYGKPAA